jgi:hypothetical protein
MVFFIRIFLLDFYKRLLKAEGQPVRQILGKEYHQFKRSPAWSTPRAKKSGAPIFDLKNICYLSI